MKKHKLTLDEMKQIAHVISQRSLSTIGGGEYLRATEKYLETYNQVMDKLEEYNTKN